MSLPFLLTFLLFSRFSKRESARDRRSSRWQKDSFVLSRPFQLIFIVCLLGQASVASHGTLLFVIVACVPRHSVFLPASFRRVEGTHLPFQTDDSRHCTWSIKSYGYGAFASNDVPSARGGYRTSSRMISRQPPREFPLPQTPSNHGKPTFYTWTYICRDLCTPFAVHAEAREINQL